MASEDDTSTAGRSDALVFFGGTGDLAFKQIYPSLYALAKHGRLAMPVVAVGRKDESTEKLRTRVSETLKKGDGVDGHLVDDLVSRLTYAKVGDDSASFAKLREAVGPSRHPLHYLALPPEAFAATAANLAELGLAKGARIVVEKPFGHDLASARELSQSLRRFFPEEAIFRLDHFLGKEAVENIVYFRAANPVFERALNARDVLSVQITMAETFGVKGRAKFYDPVGAIRDVVQNHLLEVVACLAMELPKGRGHVHLRDARSALLSQVRALSAADIVRGQVRGYQDEDGVRKDSKTETFAQLKVGIESPRWSGVPFFIRAGKSLPVTGTEAIVRFRSNPTPVLDEQTPPAPNQIRFRIGPDTAVTLGANVRSDGEAMTGQMAELVLRRSAVCEMQAYERLLGDALEGDPTAFARRDAVEESWRIVDPILDDATPVHEYEPGSWGPAEAKPLSPEWGWCDPPGST